MQVRCAQCGVLFAARKVDVKRGQAKFCSLNCSAKYGNSCRSRKRFINVCCATCGKLIRRDKHSSKRVKNHFCNRTCKKEFERSGLQSKKRTSTERRKHLKQKAEFIIKFGVVCQFPGCVNDLKGDRRVVDVHHFGNPLDHKKIVLLCPYHHRLADLGYIGLLLTKDGDILASKEISSKDLPHE